MSHILHNELKELNKSCPCQYPHHRRLYIREGSRGHQKFIPYGITCLRCGFVFSKNPIQVTKEQIEWDKIVDEYFKGKKDKGDFNKFVLDYREKIRRKGLRALRQAQKERGK